MIFTFAVFIWLAFLLSLSRAALGRCRPYANRGYKIERPK